MKQKIKIIFFILLLIGSQLVYGTESYVKQWTVGNFIGSFSQNPNVKYYIEPQLRLIGDEYVFNQAFFLAGLGYQFTPSLMFFAGPGWVLTKNTSGQTYQEYRLWQQLNWQVLHDPFIVINSRTRFEEKERNNESQIALQLRQRFWARIPIKNMNTYYYSMFDEVFFNINHPSWVSPHFFEQNRAFLGIGKELTKNTMLDFGYLNQLLLGPPRQMNNVILLSFSVVS